jgi:hypothetical protein
MPVNRLFIPQEALDVWLSDGRVEIDGEVVTFRPEGERFYLKSAVRFVQDVGGGADGLALVGKVKDLDQIKTLGGTHCRDSVIVDEHAYEVVEGFVGEPAEPELQPARGDSMASAALAAVDKNRAAGEIDLLARFFLQSK